ncbi:MAG: thermonuclease family protein [Myxococcota bacterium]|nr:thermonuclease family protein [Myxococcota bacterium]
MHHFLFTFWFVLLSCSSSQSLPFDDAGNWCQEDYFVSGQQAFDGVTIEVVNYNAHTEIHRLLGISAPGGGMLEPDESCYGLQAKEFLQLLITDELIELKFDAICSDIYDQKLSWVVLQGNNPAIAQLAKIYQPDSLYDDSHYRLLVNELLVRLGFNSVYRSEQYAVDRYMDRLEVAEAYAKAEGLGGWTECTDF